MSHTEQEPTPIYPTLYYASDNASNRAQAAELLCYRLNSAFLIIASALTLFSTMTMIVAIASAIAFLVSLSAYLYSQHKNYKGQWYQARALAESIKTASWRFMMKADPFDSSSTAQDTSRYINLLRELLKENSTLGEMLADYKTNSVEQLTTLALDIRDRSYREKRMIYLRDRIDDQLEWYLRNSRDNKKHSKRYKIWITVMYGVAILLQLIRIGNPSLIYLPIDFFAATAIILIGWKQLRRFDEHASAFSLTAHEVGIIKSRYGNVTTAAELSDFVSDAENAFSREHTQWAARRDH